MRRPSLSFNLVETKRAVRVYVRQRLEPQSRPRKIRPALQKLSLIDVFRHLFSVPEIIMEVLITTIISLVHSRRQPTSFRRLATQDKIANPTPTRPAVLPRYGSVEERELFGRQLNVDTCGYTDGRVESPFLCSGVCSSFYEGYINCCPTDGIGSPRPSCSPATTCLDYNSVYYDGQAVVFSGQVLLWYASKSCSIQGIALIAPSAPVDRPNASQATSTARIQRRLRSRRIGAARHRPRFRCIWRLLPTLQRSHRPIVRPLLLQQRVRALKPSHPSRRHLSRVALL